MESDRAWARAAIMRAAAERRGRADGASAAGWTGWRDCGVPAITGVDTRALVRHIRGAGAMRGGVFGGRGARAEAPRARRRRAADGRRRTSCARSRPQQVTRHGDGDGPADRRDRHRHQGLDRAPPRRARRARRAAPRAHERRRAAGRGRRRDLPGQRPGRPRRARLRRRDACASWSAASRCSASASATSCCAGPSAWRPSSCPFGHRGANHPVKDLRDRPHRDHLAEPRLRGARARRRRARRGRRAGALGDRLRRRRARPT